MVAEQLILPNTPAMSPLLFCPCCVSGLNPPSMVLPPPSPKPGFGLSPNSGRCAGWLSTTGRRRRPGPKSRPLPGVGNQRGNYKGGGSRERTGGCSSRSQVLLGNALVCKAVLCAPPPRLSRAMRGTVEIAKRSFAAKCVPKYNLGTRGKRGASAECKGRQGARLAQVAVGRYDRWY